MSIETDTILTPDQKAEQKLAVLSNFLFGQRYRGERDELAFHFFVNDPTSGESGVVHKIFAEGLAMQLGVEYGDETLAADSQATVWRHASHMLMRQIITIDDVPGEAMVNYLATRPPAPIPELLPQRQ
jgi:hypothetical protein